MVETTRTECLDQLLIFSHRQLEQVPCTYVEHYKGLGPIETSSLCTLHPDHPIE